MYLNLLNLHNFNSNMEYPEDGSQLESNDRKKLPEGDYNFTIKSAEEVDLDGRWGKYPALEMDFDLDGVRAPKIHLVTTASKKNQDALAAFLICVDMLNEDGTPKITEWDELVGLRGRAHFVPRDLTRSTVYNVTIWYPYDPADYLMLPGPF